MHLNVSRVLGRVFGLGFLLFVAWASFVSHLFGSLQADWATFLAAILASVALHELLHAVAALLLGARGISIGVWRRGALPLGLYVSIRSELPLAKWLVVALTPLLFSWVVLLLAQPFEWIRGLLIWLSLVNTVGSAGDLTLAIIAAGTGRHARVRDVGEAIEIVGGEPSRLSWAFLNASATLGYALLCSFLVFQILIAIAMMSGGSIELMGIELVEVVREGNGVTAQTTSSYALISLLSGLVAAAAVAFWSLKVGQSIYTAASRNNT